MPSLQMRPLYALPIILFFMLLVGGSRPGGLATRQSTPSGTQAWGALPTSRSSSPPLAFVDPSLPTHPFCTLQPIGMFTGAFAQLTIALCGSPQDPGSRSDAWYCR